MKVGDSAAARLYDETCKLHKEFFELSIAYNAEAIAARGAADP
jgi:hypothetical protein